jgi:hypothetical protein
MVRKINKYHAKKTTIDGITFASKKEANRYVELKLMEKAKAIQDLKIQVAFPLIPKTKYGREIRYIADFTYYENGELVVEDTKGFRTDVYKLKKRLMAEVHNVLIREI